MDIRKFLKTAEALHAYQKSVLKEDGTIFSVSVSSRQIHVHVAVGRRCLTRILYIGAPFSEATKLLGLVEDFLARHKPELVSAIEVNEVLCSNRHCSQRSFCRRHRLYEEMLVGRLSQTNKVEHFHKRKDKDCRYFIQDRK